MTKPEWHRTRVKILARPRWMRWKFHWDTLYPARACVICGATHRVGECQQAGLVLHSKA